MECESLRHEADGLLINLVQSSTNLTEEDIKLLLNVSHTLPVISNLEKGDTYINALTRTGESIVVAQYRYPDCDLYKRNIIGKIQKKADEPAVYRALLHGIAGRGLVGLIDEGRMIVRHTVSPIYNQKDEVIGALTFEYQNDREKDTDPIRMRTGDKTQTNALIDTVAGYMQDGFMAFDSDGICVFANAKALSIYQSIGCTEKLADKAYRHFQLNAYTREKLMYCHDLKQEIQLAGHYYEENIQSIWEGGEYRGIAVILRDKTKMKQMEDELAYRTAVINEIHHRVKNNLQTIVSLIGLESAQSKNELVREFAKTMIGRICSLSVTYDMLAHTSSATVDLQTMLKRVAESAVGNCRNGANVITTDITGSQWEVPANIASTVALIVNELIQNSVKHAFDIGQSRRIDIALEKGAEYSWITVQDNGCGFDPELIEKNGSGLGLQLIHSLVKGSLKGQIMIEGSPRGTITRFSVKNEIGKSKLQS